MIQPLIIMVCLSVPPQDNPTPILDTLVKPIEITSNFIAETTSNIIEKKPVRTFLKDVFDKKPIQKTLTEIFRPFTPNEPQPK